MAKGVENMEIEPFNFEHQMDMELSKKTLFHTSFSECIRF